MDKNILVTRSSMPDLDEYIEENSPYLGKPLAHQYGREA